MKNLVNSFVVFVICLAGFDALANESNAAVSRIVELHQAAESYLQARNVAAAIKSSAQAYELALNSLKKEDPLTTVLALSYSNMLIAANSKHEAFDVMKATRKRIEAVHGKQSIELVPVLKNLSELQSGSARLSIVRRALAIQKQHKPDEALAYAKLATNLAGHLAKAPKHREQAREYLGEALAILENEWGKKSPELIPVLMALGDANAKYRNDKKQKQFYDRAIKIANVSVKPERHAGLMRRAGLGLMQYSSSPRARRYLERARSRYEEALGADHVKTAVAGLSLAKYDLAAKHYNRAESRLITALPKLQNDANYRNHELAARSLLVNIYETTGKSKLATPHCLAIGEVSPWLDNQSMRPIFKMAPKYPASAVTSRKQGYVVLEFSVDEYGFTVEPEVVELNGPESFNTAALEAVKSFRYAPRFVNGKAVETQKVRNKFTFELSN